MHEAYQRARRLWVNIQNFRAKTGVERPDLYRDLDKLLGKIGWTYDDVLRSIPQSENIPSDPVFSRWRRTFKGPRKLRLISLRPLIYVNLEVPPLVYEAVFVSPKAVAFVAVDIFNTTRLN